MRMLLVVSAGLVAVGTYLLVSPSPAIDTLARILGGILLTFGGAIIVLLNWVELDERKSRTQGTLTEWFQALERLRGRLENQAGKQDEMMDMIHALGQRLDHVDEQWFGSTRDLASSVCGLRTDRDCSLLVQQMAVMKDLAASLSA